ncbi:MAG: diaminopimelate decarboxylase [Spirochaetia bacterium]|nr:diaminopimelate decarboxylase [Spirochaetia bacterium]
MYYEYDNNNLFWKNSNLNNLCREIENNLKSLYNYSGPYFLYHEKIIQDRLERFEKNFSESRFYYSVKSLSNINILKLIKKFKTFGLDVVSGGEIQRGLEAGFKGSEMVYAGVGKKEDEIKLGLNCNLKSFHVESISEIRQIEQVAAREGVKGPITLRLNPDIAVDTHKYIMTGVEDSKFGINALELNEAVSILRDSKHLRLMGLQIHLGSQILDTNVYMKGLDFLDKIAQEIESSLGIKIEYVSLGGGFGIDYNSVFTTDSAKEFSLSELSKQILQRKNTGRRIDFEPGRFISAHSGLLLAHVLYIKPRKDYSIAITDAGMNELIRPALYGAKHRILTLKNPSGSMNNYDIVGPICESSDFFAKKIAMSTLKEGDSIVIAHAGAYGSVMSSNYNSRPYVPEFLLDGENFSLIRKPQNIQDIYSLEII